MSRVVRSLAAVVVAVGICVGPVVHSQDTRIAPRPRRTLAEALAELQADGLKIIFSSEVVRPDMWVMVEPRATVLRRALDELLVPHGLIAQDGPGGRVLIVRNPRVRSERKPAPGAIPVARVGVPTVPDQRAETPRFVETVDVTGAQPAGVGVGAASFAIEPAAVRTLAGGFDNVFRYLQALPGVSGTDELGSRIAVRGASPDQNLTILDGVEIYNPYRLHVPSEDLGMSGITSAFNVDTIDSVELSAGAFDVRHGDRLSSLLNIRTRTGSSAEAIQGSAFVSVTDAHVTLEGRLPRRTTGSWFVSARRTHLDLVVDRVIGGSLPSFYDINGKVSWQPRAGQQLSLFGSAGRERLRPDGQATTTEDEVHATSARNYLSTLTFESMIGRRLSTRTLASTYRLADSLNAFERSLSNSRAVNTEAGIATGGPVAFQLARKVEVQDLAVRQEFAFVPSQRHALDVGADLHWLDTRWSWAIAGDRSYLQANGSSVRLGTSLPAALDSSRDSRRFGAWVQDRVNVTSRLAIQPGIRLDYSTLIRQPTLSPRLGVAWDVSPTTRLMAAFRLHSQVPGYEKMLQSDYFVDLGDDKSVRLKAERALHAVTGLQRTFGRSFTARVDGYYRRFGDLLMGRLETEDERRARLATYDVPASLIGSVPTRAEITSSPVNGGLGQAYGVEIHVAHLGGAASPLTGSGSYAIGHADRTVYDVTHPFDYDRRHAAALVMNWKITPRVDLMAAGRWATGFPRTAVHGVRLALEPDAGDGDGDGNRDEWVPQRDPSGSPFYQPDRGDLLDLNRARLPDFARVDLRLAYRPTWNHERWAFYVDVVNVLNRTNVVLVDSALVFDPLSNRPGIKEIAEDTGIPFFPSFGIRVWF